MLAGEEHGKRPVRDRRPNTRKTGKIVCSRDARSTWRGGGGKGRINWECGRTRASGAQTCPADRCVDGRVLESQVRVGGWMN